MVSRPGLVIDVLVSPELNLWKNFLAVSSPSVPFLSTQQILRKAAEAFNPVLLQEGTNDTLVVHHVYFY